jgi:hypothetical protein
MVEILRPRPATLTVPTVARRQGVVTEITTVLTFPDGDSAPAVMLQLGADTDDPAGPARYLESYVPVIGDTVELLMIGGDPVVLGRLAIAPAPRIRIKTSIATSNSAPWDDTPEVVVQTLSAVPLVAGRTYRLTWFGDLIGSVAASEHFMRIREDSLSGTVLDVRRYRAHTTANFPYRTEVEYPAVATGNKTFVFTGVRSVGTGLGTVDADTDHPAYFYVDYIRD